MCVPTAGLWGRTAAGPTSAEASAPSTPAACCGAQLCTYKHQPFSTCIPTSAAWCRQLENMALQTTFFSLLPLQGTFCHSDFFPRQPEEWGPCFIPALMSPHIPDLSLEEQSVARSLGTAAPARVTTSQLGTPLRRSSCWWQGRRAANPRQIGSLHRAHRQPLHVVQEDGVGLGHVGNQCIAGFLPEESTNSREMRNRAGF